MSSPTSPSSPSSAQDLSPSAILYACADQFVPTGSMLTAVRIPCSEHRVKYYPLAGAMLGAAVAGLIEQGRARMTVVTTKKLMVFSSTNAMLERATGAQTPAPTEGYLRLDDWLFCAIPASGQASAYDVVRAAYGEDIASPPSMLIHFVSSELQRFGYMEAASGGGTGAKLMRALELKSKWEAHCDRWAELRERVADVQALVERVKGRDPQAWELLIKQLTSGCQSRQEQQEVSSPD